MEVLHTDEQPSVTEKNFVIKRPLLRQYYSFSEILRYDLTELQEEWRS